jgi:hypothetical protein
MRERFDEWQKVEFGLYSLCTAQEFELECGLLRARAKIEVPPYAELLMQGGAHPVAVRHPEYMLARDLRTPILTLSRLRIVTVGGQLAVSSEVGRRSK